jgi:hypothetical protein
VSVNCGAKPDVSGHAVLLKYSGASGRLGRRAAGRLQKTKIVAARRPMMIQSGGILYNFGCCGVYPIKAWTAI